MRAVIMGCGGSGGVPLIGNVWGACDPAEPRNRRTRVSLLVEEGPTTLVVDTTPDFRAQMLAAGAGRLDAVLFTHDHADHCHGIDDIRNVNRLVRAPIAAYGDAHTLETLARRFAYIFAESDPIYGFYKPTLIPNPVEGPFQVGEIGITPFRQDHGFGRTTLGYRFGRLAYSTDAVSLDEAAFAALAGVEVWIVDCLRLVPHPTHSHLERTLEWIARVKPARAILTHMNHELDYRSLQALLPPGVEPGYDGLTITLND